MPRKFQHRMVGSPFAMRMTLSESIVKYCCNILWNNDL